MGRYPQVFFNFDWPWGATQVLMRMCIILTLYDFLAQGIRTENKVQLKKFQEKSKIMGPDQF